MYNNQFGWNPYAMKQSAAVPSYNQPFQIIGSWVQGIEGAKGFQMAPNTVAVLLDSENEGAMYIKNTDSIGMSTLRCYEYTEVMNTPKSDNLDLSAYVRKDELKDLIAKIAGGDKDEPAV